MRKNTVLWLVVVILLVGWGGGERGGDSDSLGISEEEYFRLIKEEIKKINNHNFILEGVVVDKEGKPLKDVELTITTHKTIFSLSGF